MDSRTYENWPSVGSQGYASSVSINQFGIEIKIDSMQNDGSQFWIVISRGMNTIHLNESPEEDGISIDCEEVALIRDLYLSVSRGQ